MSLLDKVQKVQNRIEQLIFLVDGFLRLSEDLSNFYFSNQKNINNNGLQVINSTEFRALTIQQRLYFGEVLIILGSIFKKKRKPSEVSYEHLFLTTLESDEYYKSYKEILGKYNSSPLLKLRNQLIAHKDYKYAGDPATQFAFPIDECNIQNARGIIDSLKDMNNSFNASSSSNDWVELYKKMDAVNKFLKQAVSNLFD